MQVVKVSCGRQRFQSNFLGTQGSSKSEDYSTKGTSVYRQKKLIFIETQDVVETTLAEEEQK